MTQDGPNAEAMGPQGLGRLATGVPGFDEITCGGLLETGVYILQGMPGAGKTILANQIAYGHASGGGKVVYVTMLAESHSRLLQHLNEFSFFNPQLLPQQVYYISAFDALRSHGLRGVVDLLRSEMKNRHAGVLVLDGLVMAASAARSDEELKIFVSDIQAHSVLTGCTTLLLTSEDPDRPVSAEQTMVDGILLLREKAYGVRRERKIEVLKFRGSATLRGTHTFTIGDDGVVIYPRLEAVRRAGPDGGVKLDALSTGIRGLDRMFDIGGYSKGSVNVVCGPSGCGKTTMALHFAAATAPAERTLYVGFYESPELLQAIARIEGIAQDLPKCGGGVEFMWQPFGENVLDEIAHKVLRRVAAIHPARLVIDGLGGLFATPSFEERGGSFLAAFTNELRRTGTTTLVTVEEHQPGGGEPMDTATMSALADTLVGCRVTHEDAVRRFVWIGKSRVSRADARVREVFMGSAGLEIHHEGQAGGG
jgi:circadian clock protein KaiC